MKNISHFEEFIKNEVNLNKSRIDQLESRVESVKNFISNSPYEKLLLRFGMQGSWPQKTIIRPPGNQGFDADLLVFVSPSEEHSPSDYVSELFTVFQSSGVYGKNASLGTRCVKLGYANEFDIDIVPCVQDRGNPYTSERQS